MPEAVIADASVLIIFEKVGRLNILKSLYNNITVTPEVAKEFNKTLPNWIKIKYITDLEYLNSLLLYLDEGEASIITLARELRKPPLLIIDDLNARKYASKLGLKITGSLGVLVKAKKLGLIDKLEPIIDELKETNFRFSNKIAKRVLKEVGEID